MPLAARCSGALSAACHPRDAGLRHHEKKVHWGVEVVEREGLIAVENDGDSFEHCTFTSGRAYEPVEGRVYA